MFSTFLQKGVKVEGVVPGAGRRRGDIHVDKSQCVPLEVGLDCQNFRRVEMGTPSCREKERNCGRETREGDPWGVEEWDRVGRYVSQHRSWAPPGWKLRDKMSEWRWSEWRECGLGGLPPVVVMPFGRLLSGQPPRRGDVFGLIAHPVCNVRKAHPTRHYIKNLLIMFPALGNLSMVLHLSCVLA